MNACNNCGEEIESGFSTCWKCGAEIASSDSAEERPAASIPLGIALRVGDTASLLLPGEDEEEAASAWSQLPLTTAPFFEGRPVVESLDIIGAECALGMNFCRDLMTAASDVFGGRSGTWQRQLRKARSLCLDELRQQAYERGADAVVAVTFAYSEIGSRGGMLFVVASGTAVRLVPDKTG